MKKLWKTFSSTYPVRVLAATSASVFTLNGKESTRTNRVNHLLSVAVMVIMVFAGDRLLSGLLDYINMQSHFRYSRVYSGKGESDILFLGNSRGHAFYQPAIQRITNGRTLNLSYNALPVSIGRALVEDYFDLYGPPKKMIIEVSMLAKTEKEVINEFKLYARHSERIRRVIEMNSPRTVAAISIANLYAFNTEALQRSLFYLKKTDADWIMNKKISAGMVANTAQIPQMTYKITEDRWRDLLAMINLAKGRNTDVKLVLAPFYPAFREKITNLDDFIRRIEAKTGLKVYNYAGLISDDRYFSDYMHPNKQGSIRYIEQMKLDGVL